MYKIRENNAVYTVFFFFIFSVSYTQIFDKDALKQRASQLYYQGIYPNVNQAFALFEDYNITAREREEMDYYQMVTALRLNDPGAVDLIDNFKLEYLGNRVLKTVYFDLANYYFNNEK